MPKPVAASVTRPERAGTGVGVGAGVRVLVGAGVRVLVGAGVSALVGGMGVLVGVDVAVGTDVGVGVEVGVARQATRLSIINITANRIKTFSFIGSVPFRAT